MNRIRRFLPDYFSVFIFFPIAGMFVYRWFPFLAVNDRQEVVFNRSTAQFFLILIATCLLASVLNWMFFRYQLATVQHRMERRSRKKSKLISGMGWTRLVTMVSLVGLTLCSNLIGNDLELQLSILALYVLIRMMVNWAFRKFQTG